MDKLMRKPGQKFNVVLTVHHLVLKKPGNTLDKDSTISVAVERGSKLVTSAEKEAVVNSSKDGVAEFHESLALEATLYPTDVSNSKFQEKIAKVQIRKRKKTFMGASHQVIGDLSLALHELVREEMPIDTKQLIQHCTYPGSEITYSLEIQPADDPQHRGSITQTSHLNTGLLAGGDSSRSQSHDPIPDPKDKRVTGGIPPAKVDPIKDQKEPSVKNAIIEEKKEEDDPFKSPVTFPGHGISPIPTTDGRPLKEDDIFHTAVDFGKLADFDPFSESIDASMVAENRPRDDSTFAEWNTPRKQSNGQQHSQSPSNGTTDSTFTADFSTFDGHDKPIASPQTKPPATPAPVPPIQSTPVKQSSIRSPPPMKNPFSSPSTTTTTSNHIPPLPSTLKKSNSTSVPATLPPPVPPHDTHEAPEQAAGDPNLNNLDFIKSVVVQQEFKIQQANEIIASQNLAIESLQKENDVKTKQMTDMSQVIIIQEEKLNSAQSFIVYQESIIENCNKELTALKEKMILSEKNMEKLIENVVKNNIVLAKHPPPPTLPVDEKGEYSKAEIQKCEDRLVSLVKDLKIVNENVLLKENHYTQLEALLAKTQKELSSTQKEQLTQKSTLSAKDEEIANLKKELVAMKDRERKLEEEKAAFSLQLADLEKLREQLSKQQQHPAAAGSSSTGNDVELENVREQLAELEDLRNKVQQAADYIAYQTDQMNEANQQLQIFEDELNQKDDEIHHLKEYIAKIAGVSPANIPAPAEKTRSESNSPKLSIDQSAEISALKEELAKAQADRTTSEEKLAQAAEYISYQETSLAERQTELERLQVELAALQERQSSSDSAAVTTSNEAIGKLTAENSSLKTQLEELEDLRNKLQQASEFINYQTEQQNDLQTMEEELRSLKESVASKPVVDPKLAETLKTVEALNEELKKQVSQLQSDLKQQKDLTAQAEVALTEARTLSMKLQEELQESQSTITTLQAGNEAVAELQQQKGELEEKVSQAAEYIAYQEAQMSEKDEETEKLRAEITEKETKIADLKQSMEEDARKAAEEHQAVEQNIVALNERVDELTEENANLKSQLENYSTELQELDELKKKVQQAAEFISYQTEQLNNSNETIEELEAENAKKDEEITLLKSNESVQTDLLKSKAENEELSKTITQLRESLQKEQTTKTSLEKELSEVKERAQQLQSAIETLQSKSTELPEDREEKEQLRKDLENLRTENEVANQKVQQAAEYIEYQTGSIKDLEDEIARLNEELSKQQSSANGESELDARDKAAFQELEEKVSQAAEYIAYQETQITKKDEELEKLRSELAEKENTIEQLQKDLAASKALLDKKNTATDVSAKASSEKATAVKDLETKLQALAKEKEELSTKLQQAREFIDHQAETLQQAESEVTRINEELMVTEEEKVAHQEAIDTLKAKLEAAEKANDSLLKEKTELASQFDEFKRKKKEESVKLLAKDDRLKELADENEALTQRLTQATDFIEYQSKHINEAGDEINRLEEEVNQKTEELNNLRDSLTEEIDELKKQLEKESDRTIELEKQLTDLRQQKLSSEKTKSSKDQETEQLQQALDRLQIESNDLKTKLKQAKDYIDYQTKALKEAEEEMTSIREGAEKTKSLEDRNRQLAKELEDLKKSSPVSPKKAANTVDSSIPQRIQEVLKENHELQMKLEAVEKHLAYQNEHMEEASQELDQLREEVEEKDKEIKLLKENLAKKASTPATPAPTTGASTTAASAPITAQQRQHYESLIKELQEANNENLEKIEQLETELDAKVTEVQELQQFITSASSSENISVRPQQDTSAREASLRQLEKEFHDLQEKYSNMEKFVLHEKTALLAEANEIFKLLAAASSSSSSRKLPAAPVVDQNSDPQQLMKALKAVLSQQQSWRSEKDKEHEDVVHQLIESKLQLAVVTGEMDSQKKRFADLSREYQRLKNMYNQLATSHK